MLKVIIMYRMFRIVVSSLIALLIVLATAFSDPAASASVQPTSPTSPTLAQVRAATTLGPSVPPTPGCASAVPPRPTTALELYGTIHSMGVVVSVGANDDPDRNATASVEYRTGDKPYRAGFPLSRVSSTRFVGSLFWLEPGATYDVRVTLLDKGGTLDCVTLPGRASTRAEITIPAPRNSYYVSPTGSGAACTVSEPCALTTGLNRAGPGQAVVLRGGLYYQGEIKLPRSGRADAPIMIQGYPGETAVLDGADPGTFTWTNIGEGIYRTASRVPDINLVLADGQRLYPYQSLKDLQGLRWKVPGFYAEGTALYVHLANDADPSKAAIVVGRRSYAFLVEQSFVYILNLTFRYYGQGDSRTALIFQDASDNLVQASKFAINDLGIALFRESHRNVIQNNEFYDTIRDWPWDAFYPPEAREAFKKPIGWLDRGGIRFWRPDLRRPRANLRGNIIRRNIFHDYFDGFGVCPGEASADATNETDVYENLVYNAGDDGVESELHCSNVRIWGNTFHDALVGVALAPAQIGPVYAIRNLIYRTGRPRDCPSGGEGPCGGTSFKFGYEVPGSGPMYLFHNTGDAGTNSPGIFLFGPALWPILVSRNNVWASNTSWAIWNMIVENAVDFDHDNLVSARGWSLVRWGDTRYLTLRDFAAATGQERHGLNIDSGFVDPSKGDYRLLPNSQLVDAGVLIPGINDDFNGRAPDIGAFESENR